MRILAPLALILTVLCLLALVTTALGKDAPAPPPPQAAPATEGVPALFPMTTSGAPATSTPPVRSTGIAEPVVIAAVYWVLLGGLALRRATRVGRLAG